MREFLFGEVNGAHALLAYVLTFGGMVVWAALSDRREPEPPVEFEMDVDARHRAELRDAYNHPRRTR